MAETVEPAKAALDHPPPGQQHKALFRFLELDHLQLNALLKCRAACAGSLSVPLIGKGHRGRVSRYLLDLILKLR
jgi:hypothetical protein